MNGSRLEKKPFWTKKKLLIMALVLCVCVMLAALVYIGYYLQQYFVQKAIDDRIGDQFRNIKGGNTLPAVLPSADAETPSPEVSPNGPAPSHDGLSPQQRRYQHLLALEAQGKELYTEILAQNPDWKGIITIPGLGIETSYVQGPDNDYYLYRSFEGKHSLGGTVFMHCDNDRLLTDRNTVLFGHNMKTGAMFARLMEYKKAEAYQKYPIIVLDGLIGESTWIVFAAYVTEPDWGYIEPNPDRDSFSDMLEEMKARSIFITDVDVNEDDQILTLSTCTYEADDMRFAVHARLLRPGENAPEQVNAVKNADQKPYNIPNQMKLADVSASNIAIMPYPSRTYYYQPREGGIDWYSGNATTVQGVYSNFTGKVTKDSYLSAVYNPDEKKTYLALDRYNNQKGIVLLTNRLPSGNMLMGGTVTPSGVDARYPALSLEEGTVWLLYTVVGTDGEEVYRRKLENGKASGDPELLLIAPVGSGTRPLGYYVIDGVPLLFWHETANKTVYGAWEDSDPFVVTLDGAANRVTVYGTLSGSKIKAASEKAGKLTFTAIDLSAYPAPSLPVSGEASPPETGEQDVPNGEGVPEASEEDPEIDDAPDGGGDAEPSADPPSEP